ncbi:hypothetical protein TIFTF001_033657 [Ficus carica]|uniref:Uncharacterized protein n=1 Tax=Ficus carica TaxID=3494 RepID=A0AA88J7H2_FICCA|nr:hypothetical protein TIFTF001_033657 [Ficus carica]
MSHRYATIHQSITSIVDAENDSGSNTQCDQVVRRPPRARVPGATRSGRPPRAPDGRLRPRPAGATGPIDWRHMGPDLTSGRATPVANGYRDKVGVSSEARWKAGSEDLCQPGIYCSDSDAQSTALSEYMACSGENEGRGRPMFLLGERPATR